MFKLWVICTDEAVEEMLTTFPNRNFALNYSDVTQ